MTPAEARTQAQRITRNPKRISRDHAESEYLEGAITEALLRAYEAGKAATPTRRTSTEGSEGR